MCITQWGDNIDQQAVQIGMDITVSVDIQSREYNGNWYTDIKAWRVEQEQVNKMHLKFHHPVPKVLK